jgi:hypothetical protein
MLPNAVEENIYFYIPYEVIKRYDLPKDPDFYAIRITIDGTKMPLGEKEFCAKSDKPLKNADEREEFYKKVKENSDLYIYGLYNANQLPPYANLSPGKQPTLQPDR